MYTNMDVILSLYDTYKFYPATVPSNEQDLVITLVNDG